MIVCLFIPYTLKYELSLLKQIHSTPHQHPHKMTMCAKYSLRDHLIAMVNSLQINAIHSLINS